MSKTSVDFVFSTVSACVLFISPNDFVFSTVSSRILSKTSVDYVFSTILPCATAPLTNSCGLVLLAQYVI